MIEGPVEFRMGSPPTEPDRMHRGEIPHRLLIPRRFAIAAKEVTVEQFQRFLSGSSQLSSGLPPSFLTSTAPTRKDP